MNLLASKREAQILFGRHLANPLVNRLVRAGLNPPGLGLIETTGRKTGLTRRVPVMYSDDTDGAWLIAQHGRNSGWVRNLHSNPQVRLRIGRTWHSGTATLRPDDDVRARARTFSGSTRIGQALSVASFWALETTPVSVRLDFS